jgi:hypothetical protein
MTVDLGNSGPRWVVESNDAPHVAPHDTHDERLPSFVLCFASQNACTLSEATKVTTTLTNGIAQQCSKA